ncbi:MAG: hypothetical protein KF760_24830 [Candidatus Eremiobacteraeota bacterium]|nr:hypothetical protein [Candidatus Eremiobacteraeota bacterium]
MDRISPSARPPGFNTHGTVALQGGSWSAEFSTVCPASASYETKISCAESAAPFHPAPLDAMLKVNQEQVYQKIGHCLTQPSIREDPQKQLNEALTRLKELETAGASVALVEQVHRQLEACHASASDLARALSLEARLRAGQHQWLPAIELTRQATPALKAQLKNYRSQVWTEVDPPQLSGVDPATFKFPASEKLQGLETTYLGIVFPTGQKYLAGEKLAVLPLLPGFLTATFDEYEARLDLRYPEPERSSRGGEGDGFSLGFGSSAETTQKWRLQILELELGSTVKHPGTGQDCSKVERLALDFIYKDRGPVCSYGKLRYHSHYR